MSGGEFGPFVLENVPHQCDLKSAVIEFAAVQRGLDVVRVDRATVLVHVPTGVIPFVGLNGPDSSFVGKWLSDHKNGQRALAAHRSLPVAESATFPASRPSRGLRYARQLGWPVVVKPNGLSRGRGVTVGVRDEEHFRDAWRRAVDSYRAREPSNSRRVLVEQHVAGEDFRFFVVDGRVVSVTHRVRANVLGDGEATVSDLIRRKNAMRSENPYLRDYPIPEGPDVLDALTSAGRTLRDVPAEGELVVLRTAANLSAGGDSVDVTDDVDPYFVELAMKAVRAVPGLAYGGVGIITPDVVSAPAANGMHHIVSDVEFSPAPMAHFPTLGIPRDIAGAIVDHYLTNPRWDAARLHSHILGSAQQN